MQFKPENKSNFQAYGSWTARVIIDHQIITVPVIKKGDDNSVVEK